MTQAPLISHSENFIRPAHPSLRYASAKSVEYNFPGYRCELDNRLRDREPTSQFSTQRLSR